MSRILFHPLTLRWLFGTDFLARRAAEQVFHPLTDPQQLTARERGRLLASLALPGVPSAWARERSERYEGFDGYQPARTEGCVLLLHGERDRIVAPAAARQLQAAIPGATLEWLPGAGHAAVIVDSEAIAARLLRFDAQCR